jgi:hypothetical protein
MDRSLNTPHPVPELEQHFVTSVSAGSDFVVALTDLGYAFVFDDCVELVRLPTASNVAVRHIAAYDHLVLGMTTDGHMYEWTEPALSCRQSQLLSRLVQQARVPCTLMTWSGKAFSVSSFYTSGLVPIPGLKHTAGVMFKTSEQVSSSQAPSLGKFLTEINPYRRANYTKKLIETSQVSLDDSFESSRLILDQDDDRSFAIAVQMRLEQEQTDVLVRSLLPMTSTRLSFSLARIREYAENKRVYDSTVAHGRLPNSLVRVLSHAHTQLTMQAFNAVKHMSHLISMNCLNVEQESLFIARAKQEGAKTIGRALRTAFSDSYSLRAAFVNLKFPAFKEKRTLGVVTRLVAIEGRLRTLRLRESVKKWTDFVIRIHIRGHGVKKLQSVLNQRVGRTGLQLIKSFGDRRQQARHKLGQVLGHDKAVQRRFFTAFVNWRVYSDERKADQLKRRKIYQLIAKVVRSRLAAAVMRVQSAAWQELLQHNPTYSRHNVARLVDSVQSPISARYALLLSSLRSIKQATDRRLYLGDSDLRGARLGRVRKGNEMTSSAFNFDEILTNRSVSSLSSYTDKPPLSSRKPPVGSQFLGPKKVSSLNLGSEGGRTGVSTEADEMFLRPLKKKHSGSFVVKSVAASPRNKATTPHHRFSKPNTPSSKSSAPSKHNRCLTPHCCHTQLLARPDLETESVSSVTRGFKAIDARLITQHLMSSQDSDNYLRRVIGMERLVKAWHNAYMECLRASWMKLKYGGRLYIPVYLAEQGGL